MTRNIGKSQNRLWKSPCFWAITFMLLGLLVSAKVARYEAGHRLNDAKNLVTHDLATVRVRLENVVGSVFSSTSGMVSVIGLQGDISSELFDSMAAKAIKIHPQIRNIALAPDNTISKVYPLDGNERVLGMSYASIPEQYRTVQQAMGSGQAVLDGPRRLIQGGDGFILRSPVFTQTDPTIKRGGRYWGVVSIVSDMNSMLDASGVRSATGLKIALRKSPADGGSSDLIWGDANIFNQSPVSMPVSVPGGEWQIAAIRAEGWPSLTVTEYPIFYFGLLNSILLAGVVWLLAARHRQMGLENYRLVQEIKEREKVEQQLGNERQRFRNLVDSIDGIVWEADAETFTFTYVSRQAERLLGYPMEEWYKPEFWEEHLHPDDRTWALTYCANSTAKKEDHDFEYRFITQDGAVVWLHDIVTVVSENGRPRWLRGIMVDMTASKQREAEKLRLEAQLRQAQKMEAIGRLAGGIAHDFNNKLAVILGYAEMAQRADISAERHAVYLGQVVKAAEQSRDITRQLLAFSRQEVITPKVIDLNDLIRDSRAGLLRFIGEDIRFELSLAEKLWPISMDPTQVDQIIMNLVVNARDAMSDVGLLTIATANVSLDESLTITNPDFKPGDYIMMTVSDNGSGMDNETLQHIFEPFFTTKESGKGTGLGLATIYGIVTQNNGFINVYSEPGIGTTFKIYFPRCHETDNRAASEQPEPQLEKNATILLVEDDETVRELVCEILTEIGYTIVTATSPLEAVGMCTAGSIKPDLLLTDVIMPEMNGRELAQQIRACQPNIRTLFMSGYTSDIISQKGILGEGLNFITKPFDRISLHNRIQEVLNEES